MNAVKNTYAAPTDKQLDYATALAKKAGYRFLGDAYKAAFGRNKIGGWNREECSQLIDWLRSK